MNTRRYDESAVRELAYNLWLERGKPVGSPEVDWERAEQLMELSGDDDNAAHTESDSGFAGLSASAAVESGEADARDDGVMDGSAEGMMVPAITELAREAAERDPAGSRNRRRGGRP